MYQVYIIMWNQRETRGYAKRLFCRVGSFFLSSWPRNRILRRSISRHRFRSLERSLRPLASRLTSPERALASSATSVELAIAYSGDISSRGRNHGCTWEDCDVHRVFFCFFVIRARIPVSAVHAFFFFPFCCCCGVRGLFSYHCVEDARRRYFVRFCVSVAV